ncbi:MAG TPA: hypothetical protein VFM60_04315 [Salinimicrobium sp.]|nr:hypothetical protein [Salinimicrobium sp.]
MKTVYLMLFLISFSFTNCTVEDNKQDCSGKTVISDEIYNSPSDPHKIIDATVTDDILKLSIVYGGGCKEVCADLIAQEKTLITDPLQRNINIFFVDNDMCEALIKEDWSFNISSLQVDGENEIQLNLEGYPEPFIYRY